MIRVCWVGCLVVFAAFALACGGGGKSSNKEAPPEDTKEQKELKAKRKEAVDGLMKRGAFTAYSREAGASTAEVKVTPQFMALDEPTKLSVVLILTDYLFDLPKGGKLEFNQAVRLVHSVTGKEVGRYTTDTGLQME